MPSESPIPSFPPEPSTAGTLGLFGPGRLGQAIAEAAGPQLAWQIGRGEALPHAEPPLVAIDASLPDAVDQHLDWAMENRCDLVIAVTGWTPSRTLDNLPIGVLLAPNGSLTVALFARLARILGAYASTLPLAEAYLLDHHHSRKRDAPSGTALRLLDAWNEGIRDASNSHEPQVTSLRCGHEIGSHTLGLDTPDEIFEIRHRARGRGLFARGLLSAASWLRGRRGCFRLDDVAADLLDPLFASCLSTRPEARTPASTPNQTIVNTASQTSRTQGA